MNIHDPGPGSPASCRAAFTKLYLDKVMSFARGRYVALSSAVLSSPRQAFDFRFIHMLRCSEKAARRGAGRPGREVSPKEDDAGSPRAASGSDFPMTLAALAVGCILTALTLRSRGGQVLAREAPAGFAPGPLGSYREVSFPLWVTHPSSDK